MGSQAMIPKHAANNKSYQFQASIVTEAILGRDVHVLPWAPAAHLSGLRHLQVTAGLLPPLRMGSGNVVALSGSNYGCLIIAVGGAWGLQHSEEKKSILYSGPVQSFEWAVPIDTFQSCGKSKPLWLWHLYGNCKITKQNIMNVGCYGPLYIAKSDRS